MEMRLPNVKKKSALIIVNFGGPRSLDEIPTFLKSLLCDKEVIQTPFIQPIHNYLFSRIAKKRAKKVAADYLSIGGKSPIYEDTESVAQKLRSYLSTPIFTFHRYIPATHEKFIQSILSQDIDQWNIFPMFPQFSYTTTGSIAKWFSKKLPTDVHRKMFWLKSYPTKKPFVELFVKRIENYFASKNIPKEDCLLFFSAHGLPQKYVDQADPYEQECQLSYQEIAKYFPQCQSLLAYQSKFGPGEWLKPYTVDVCKKIKHVSKDKKHVLFIPLAFTSDHIETLFEIEQEYMPIIQENGLSAHRLSAFNDQADWIETIDMLLKDNCPYLPNQMLVRST